MEVYNQFVHPTLCQLSVYCNFTGKNDDNLIISKGNQLQVFLIKKFDNGNQPIQYEENLKATTNYENEIIGDESLSNVSYKLVLISEYSLNGKILDIHKFKCKENNSVDYLIVSTEVAKISIIKWNPSDNLISVVSLHYYEHVLNAFLLEKINNLQVLHRTDSNNSCTLMQVDELFIFLPFINDLSAELYGLNDDYLSGASKIENSVTQNTENQMFFKESFIIKASKICSDLKNIVDVQFLKSYKDPTIAVLYAPESLTWAGYLPKVKDNMKVVVLSLNLERKKANKIIEISNLPFDVDRIIPLEESINGFLLIGSNEIIHVNSLGSTKGVFVNEYFTKISEMSLVDQSDLDLFLEQSEIAQMTDSEALLVTKEGKLFSLIFDEIGGVSNLTKIIPVEKTLYSEIKITSILHISKIPGKNLAFLCCQSSDSILLSWEFQKKSIQEEANNDVINEVYDPDEDWLYGGDMNQNIDLLDTSLTKSDFTVMDKLINIGPLSDFTMGMSSLESKLHGLPNPNYKETTIYGSSGLEQTGSISIIAPTVKPIIKSSLKFSNATKIWTVNNYKGETEYLITTDLKSAKTQIFEILKNYKELHKKSFRNNHYTIQFGSLRFGVRVRPVQVTQKRINIYNMVFSCLTTMGFEREINSSIIHENFIIVIMTTGEIEILEYDDDTKTLTKMDLPALLNYLIFTNAWISKSSLLHHATPSKKRNADGDLLKIDQEKEEEILFWLVTADNRLLVFKKEHFEKVLEFKNIHKMSEYLQLSDMDPSYEADVDPILKQCIYTKIGGKYDAKDYLIILTFGGEIIMYESFFDPVQQRYRLIKSNDLFQLPITGAPGNSYSYATKIERNLFKMDNVDGSQIVMVTGAMPFMIFKQYNSFPRMFRFTATPLLHFAQFSTDKCLLGMITIDDKKSCRMVQLDFEYDYSNKFPIKKVNIGQTINKIAYHEPSNTFLLSILKKEDYKPVDSEGNTLPGYDETLRKHAQNFRSEIRVLSPKTWNTIDVVELKENETCTSLDVMSIKVNGTDGNRTIIFVGTSILQNEDTITNGSWKLFNMVNVVPEPEKPEAVHRLKLLSSEVGKGPVSCGCAVDGRFSVIQGQRLMVRMMKGEGTAAPVAFADTSLYSNKVKAFENMVLIGDAFDSVSLYGFDAEPYRMVLLGKDENKMALSECEFVIHNQNLYILAADDNSVLHIFQYDPFDSGSSKGQKLLRKSAFRSNAFTTKMRSYSRRSSLYSMVNTLPIRSDVDLGFEIFGTNIDGSIYKVSPINEYQYRRLYTLQNHIADKENHWLGLNPRMNAVGNLQNEMPIIKRPFIEYRLLTKFSSMSEDKKNVVAVKLGKNALVDIYRDMISLQ